jgi:hypothetical protein
MLEAVLVFAGITALFEFIIVAKLPPNARYWVIHQRPGFMHAVVIAINLWIHFGTITGTMTAVTAGLASFATIAIARLIWRHPLIA